MPIISRNGKVIPLYAAEERIDISEGKSSKLFLTDGTNQFILKRPKRRTFHTIFATNFPIDLDEYKEWTVKDFYREQASLPPLIAARLEPFAMHLSDLLLEAVFGEVLYQLIAKALFTQSFTPTENYLHVDKTTGEPCVISKFCPAFNEFLDKRLLKLVGKKVSVSDWEAHSTLSREDLKLTPNENHLLGKLYALALITNDWDLVNNIMLSNAGCVGNSAYATKIMVVDGGNKFHFGFDGLTCDETAFKNKAFNPLALKKPRLKDYNHTLPFDEEVYLHLPRLLVPDLFSLKNYFLFKGFKAGIEEAKASLVSNPYCIQQAIRSSCHLITIDSHPATWKRLWKTNSTVLHHTYYYSRGTNEYTLESLLVARLSSLARICRRLELGESIESIDATTVTHYRNAQFFSSPSFFRTVKEDKKVETSFSMPMVARL